MALEAATLDKINENLSKLNQSLPNSEESVSLTTENNNSPLPQNESFVSDFGIKENNNHESERGETSDIKAKCDIQGNIIEKLQRSGSPLGVSKSDSIVENGPSVEHDMEEEKDSDESSETEDRNTQDKANGNTRDDDREPIQCGECMTDFETLQMYMEHKCTQSQVQQSNRKTISAGDDNDSDLSDGESFEGKIVYNPDGSAYIIEGDSELSEDDSIELPQQEGSIVDRCGKASTSQYQVYPQIANAVYIHRNPAFYNTFYTMMPERKPEAPVMHSFRVFDVRSKECVKAEDKGADSDVNLEKVQEKDIKPSSKLPLVNSYPVVPSKPILMCFICKLSFGFTKSFTAHATGEHNMVLNEKEKNILNNPAASAIIQGLGKDKEPLMSFLEPNAKSADKDTAESQPPRSIGGSTYFPSSVYNTSMSHTNAYTNSKPTPMDITVSAKLSRDPLPSDGRSQEGATGTLIPGSNPKPAQDSIEGAMKIDANIDKNPESSKAINATGNGPMELEKAASNRDDPDMLLVSPDTANRLNNNDKKSMFDGGDGPGRSERGSSSSSYPTTPVTPGTSMAEMFHKMHATQQQINQVLLQSVAITGTCDEHPQGRQQGVECPKCDMILGSSRSLGGHMTMMHSRNSCKTLKCPKCNWHYKYQETLEIHMKEKHPDSEVQCIYCITNQAHPRLARGESYTCGYKPYRCDVCNYSTTTKGNLSIHMQSDKHINNMQELQQHQQQQQHSPQPVTGAPSPTTPTNEVPMSPKTPPAAAMQDQNALAVAAAAAAAAAKKLKPKPSWRCDVCNYETNVARNLRIHMTSEKHTHNMMVLQQNVKHMQRDMQMQMAQMAMMQDGSMINLTSPTTPVGMPPGFPGFQDQGMFMVPMGMGGQPVGDAPVDLSKEQDQGHESNSEDLTKGGDMSKIYQCYICAVFSTDSLEALHQHMQTDRTKHRDGENVIIANGNYLCNLCQYKTNLKANFQLHCKTDKHLQRVQLVNHIREGGPQNEWRLKYMNLSNPIQVKCNACDYYTNSIHKLQIHATNPRHEANSHLFHHLQKCEALVKSENVYFHCTLCNYSTKAKVNLMAHVRSMGHMQNENANQCKAQEQGREPDQMVDIFLVRECPEDDSVKFEEDGDVDAEDMDVSQDGELVQEKDDTAPTKEMTNDSSGTVDKSSEPMHVCPFCNYSSTNELRIRAHIFSQHQQQQPQQPVHKLLCPLCQQQFPEKGILERHLVQVHNVSQDAVSRLLLIVDQSELFSPGGSEPTNTAATPGDQANESSKSATTSDQISTENEDDDGSPDFINLEQVGPNDEYRCQTCTKTFQNIDLLYSHQNELGHLELKQTPRGPGYLCWKKGCNQYFKTAQSLQIHFREIHAKKPGLSVSDRHVYKFRCNQCSLAFKTLEKLQQHSQYHLIRAASRCMICGRSFRTVAAMQKHVEITHFDSMTDTEMEQYRNMLASNPLAMFPPMSENAFENDLKQEYDSVARLHGLDDELTQADRVTYNADDAKERPASGGSGDQDSLDSDEPSGDGSNSNDSSFVDDYINSQAIAENSYNDPSRKYKCHRCKVAFTKQSYLSAHNKTLLHRRGDKLNYPMEKYLDPNRPFKCETCKESFTQKNILLVHYNSVSHLHKLKQQQQNLPGQKSNASISPPPSTTPVTSVAPSLPNTAASTPPADQSPKPVSASTAASIATSSSGDDKKPYKCNICKVSYSQGSTLDIHMRSVLHQTRASKLHELAITGQIDLSQPLIEQPDTQVQAHKKLLADMLQQKQIQHTPSVFMSSGLPPVSVPLPLPAVPQVSKPSTPTSSSVKPPTPQPSRTPTSSGIMETESASTPITTTAATKPEPHKLPTPPPKPTVPTCNRCNATFNSHEILVQHQQIYCYYQPQFNRGVKHQLQKSLLQNFGFECVMQYNEYSQRVKDFQNGTRAEDGKLEIKKEEVEYKDNKPLDMPELNKLMCLSCRKQFSSVWVLKAHQEEVHKELVPTKILEQYGDDFKDDFEKKCVEQASDVPASVSNSQSTPTSTEMAAILDMPPPTPTSEMMMPHMPMFNMMQMPFSPLGMPMIMPPLMPMLPGLEGMTGNLPPVLPPMVDPGMMANIQKQQQQQAQIAAQNKRARTRISDEQLKVLRAHFDINNSPSEEQIIAMSDQSGLPQKVIKHWFRNTLFKERQRNKDSPYNFNNPPQTTLNLEEYERTGKFSTTSSENGEEKERRDLLHSNDDSDDDFDSSIAGDDCPTPTTPLPPQTPTTMFGHALSMQVNSPSTAELSMSYMSSYATPSQHGDDRSETGSQSGSTGKRANRTRFTDFQIKSLQESFEQNAYPKDDELEHLSKTLGLSPRVIVVWFQNARQKARKNYENQPSVEEDTEGNRFQRTPGLNYQCKKCMTVFQRYYELIKHQKKICYKDEDISLANAFGVAAEDESNESSVTSGPNQNDSAVSLKEDERRLSDKSAPSTPKTSKDEGNFKCEKCNLVFNRFDLWKEHQNVHLLNPNLFPAYPPDSAFAMLQNVAHAHQNSAALSSPIKRKMSETIEDDEFDEIGQPRDKRLRTTILPEQLDYLYQKYQLDCNPSRKQLEAIASDVGLKKRVVQVWFQNTRARERKGQYRAHTQLIHKRCPFCRALFRAKSALESHLATKHPEEMAKGEINIDNIPDASGEPSPVSPLPPTPTSSTSTTPPGLDMKMMMANPLGMQPFMPFMPPGFGLPPAADPLHQTMKRMYEDSLKKYIDELSAASHTIPPPHHSVMEPRTSVSSIPDTPSSKPSTVSKSENSGDDTPLDLSKPVKIKTENNNNQRNDGPLTNTSLDDMNNSGRLSISFDDSRSETYSECTDNMEDDCNSNPASPNSLNNNSYPKIPGKRYRTQMTNVQIRVMKMLFQDYKTPTMAECEMLGQHIGLAKRVVQVWFQNARAKEKKAKLAMSKHFGQDVEFNRPPSECKLCNFKYSHKYTIQDHVFTKKHIENIRKHVQNEADAESSFSSPMTSLLRQHESEQMRKMIEAKEGSLVGHPHLSQLHAMGLNAMGLPGLSPGSATSPGNVFLEPKKSSTPHRSASESAVKVKQEPKEDSSTSQSKKKESTASTSSATSSDSSMNSSLLSPFGALPPGADAAFLPFMYPGMAGLPFPGMGMPFMPPGLFPGLPMVDSDLGLQLFQPGLPPLGTESLFAFDPTTYGTPLALLQIPQQAIKNVASKILETDTTLAQYTQDCLSLADIKNVVSVRDAAFTAENPVDVGYVCKKCHMVYPQRESCVNHQRNSCFPGKNPNEIKSILKLEQVQYKCTLCVENFSTLQEYKLHSTLDSHKLKLSKAERDGKKGEASLSQNPQNGDKTESNKAFN